LACARNVIIGNIRCTDHDIIDCIPLLARIRPGVVTVPAKHYVGESGGG